MEKVYVVARAKALAGKEKELEAALRAAVAPSQAEAGCDFYDLYAADEPGLFYFFERWVSREALVEHTQTAHYAALGKAVESLLDGTIVVDKLVPVV